MSKPGNSPHRARVGQRLTFAVAVVATATALAGCASANPHVSRGGIGLLAQPEVTRGTASPVPRGSPQPLSAADTAFGLDVLGAWCRGHPESNIVFSPESLATGLSLAYLGARGSTAAAMARVLHLPAGGGPRAEADMRASWAALGQIARPGITLAGSNRIWADPSLLPLRGYLDAVATDYDAGVSRAPLRTDPAKAGQIITAAIDRDTRGHIPELLPPGALAGDVFVLTDALYLDAAWATPFQPSATAAGPFMTAAGGTATASYLHGSGYRYATSGGWTAVSLPYRGGKLAMTALLPPAGSAGCQLPAAASLGQLSDDLDGAGPSADVALPKVDLSSHQDMNGLLTGLGMGIAFSTLANFAGLSPAAASISTVEHAATLQVAERGTVGSAATAVGFEASSAHAVIGPQVDFDRPYLMLVTGTATGEPLFLARVTNPAVA
ncbi:MAG: serpin family protein, partial [Streptosporangiaceae bacterium]